MPKKLRSIGLALILASVLMGAAGCGNDDPEPSIDRETAATLLAELDEIEANVEVGSCVVAGDRTDSLISEIDGLPDSVNEDVKSALENGANNLRLLLADPDQCEGRTTTVEPTTTEQQPTTTREQTTTQAPTTTRTTPTQTQTTQTQTQTTPTSPSGGVGPGAQGGL